MSRLASPDAQAKDCATLGPRGLALAVDNAPMARTIPIETRAQMTLFLNRAQRHERAVRFFVNRALRHEQAVRL